MRDCGVKMSTDETSRCSVSSQRGGPMVRVWIAAKLPDAADRSLSAIGGRCSLRGVRFSAFVASYVGQGMDREAVDLKSDALRLVLLTSRREFLCCRG